MGSLLVVTGPPGSGKSTLSALITGRFERSALVEGDAFFDFLSEGWIAPWLPESNEQNQVVIEAAGVATGRFVEAGYDVVFEGIIGPWFLSTFLAATGVDHLDWVVLLPSEAACRARVETRARAGFSDLEATSKMHGEFSRAGIDSHHLVDSGSMSPDELVHDVEARRAEGTLRIER
jgi:cytidylate kinase